MAPVAARPRSFAHALPHLREHPLDVRPRGLIGERAQGLDQLYACAEQRAHLPREQGKFGRRNPVAEAGLVAVPAVLRLVVQDVLRSLQPSSFFHSAFRLPSHWEPLTFKHGRRMVTRSPSRQSEPILLGASRRTYIGL